MNPSLAKEIAKTPKDMELETLNLLSKAADAISLGDRMDKLQRGYKQIILTSEKIIGHCYLYTQYCQLFIHAFICTAI
jgi:hypothetical protein